MSALLILVIAIVLLGLGYVFYGGWLAKQWGVDPNRETPAHTSYDGKDFVPANPAVLMGHHFSSIAGAGPINGPIQAAVFGWVPVFLWCVLGGIFFGAMHDFGALFASIRHNGGSIGQVMKDSMGIKAQRLFIVFALAVLILVIASFTSVVASTFEANYTKTGVDFEKTEVTAFEDGKNVYALNEDGSYKLIVKDAEGNYPEVDPEAEYFVPVAAEGVTYFAKDGVKYVAKDLAETDATKVFVPVGKAITTGAILPNASTAMTSMLFILIAIVFGYFVYRKNAKVGPATIIGIIGIIAIVFVGLKVGLNLGRTFWVLFIAVYVTIASLLPVWILLQPRDYLSSFLLYGMMFMAVVAIIGGTVTGTANMEVPMFTGWKNAAGQPLFPFLFITVACGACSGFHSLISSGTSSKQINNEKDAKIIGYGSMIIESALGIISLIAVGVVYKTAVAGGDGMSMSSPPTIFAGGIATLFSSFAPATKGVIRNLFTLAVSVFALTSLDSATRLCRYLFAELLTPEGKTHEDLTGVAKFLTTPIVSTLIMVVIGCGIGFLNLNQIWGVFGAANQLLAAVAMLAVCTWLGKIGKNNKMFYFPMCFMLVATITALCYTIVGGFGKIAAGAAWGVWFQVIWSIILVVLAVILAVMSLKTLIAQGKNKQKA